MMCSRLPASTFALLAGLSLTGLGATPTTGGLRYIEAQRPGGYSAAVVVDHQDLVYTTQVFATGAGGENAVGGTEAQVERTFENLSAALQTGGVSFDRIVKINIYVTDPTLSPVVGNALTRRFTGVAKPAITLMSGKLPVSGVFVAMDAVAAAPSESTRNVAVRLFPHAVHPTKAPESQAAVLPAGPVLFVSGRAEPGDSEKAARDTMAKLGADLELLGLRNSDIVQVKAFVSPITATEAARRGISAFFGDQAVPPLVFVEWRTRAPQVEIELVAAARVRSGEQPAALVEYLTPPGEKANPFFTQLVRVNRGKLIYTAGLFGETDQAAEPQIREIFAQLREVLQKAGSDFEHMAKATYYTTDAPSSNLLNTIRSELYDPRRPPAASKVSVTGTGYTGKTITLDMIAVAQ